MSLCLRSQTNHRIAMKQTNKSFESMYIHDYKQVKAFKENFFYWIEFSFCTVLEQQKVCRLVFSVFRKYQLWIALSMFLKLCLISGSRSYCCSNNRTFTPYF